MAVQRVECHGRVRGYPRRGVGAAERLNDGRRQQVQFLIGLPLRSSTADLRQPQTNPDARRLVSIIKSLLQQRHELGDDAVADLEDDVSQRPRRDALPLDVNVVGLELVPIFIIRSVVHGLLRAL